MVEMVKFIIQIQIAHNNSVNEDCPLLLAFCMEGLKIKREKQWLPLRMMKKK